MDINPQELAGHWKAGFALDLHTSSSTPIRELKTVKIMVEGIEKEIQHLGNITGWNTIRPAIAEELYRLKYWKEKHRAEVIGNEAATFLEQKLPIWNINLIIPIPPSDITREFQPVYEIAKQIGLQCNLQVDLNVLKKLKATSQLKEIEEPEKRKEILKDAFSISAGCLSGKNVLLFDDLYRSGETLNTVCDIVINQGKAAGVYALTITKTRTKR